MAPSTAPGDHITGKERTRTSCEDAIPRYFLEQKSFSRQPGTAADCRHILNVVAQTVDKRSYARRVMSPAAIDGIKLGRTTSCGGEMASAAAG